MESLDQLDKSLMLWLNYDGGAWQDALWYYVSQTWFWIPLYLWLLWIIWRRCANEGRESKEVRKGKEGKEGREYNGVRHNWKPFLLILLCIALVILIADQTASGLIKHLVERPRPSRDDSGISEWIHIVYNYRGGHYGFVSSHAANTCGLALFVTLLLKKGLPQPTSCKGWHSTSAVCSLLAIYVLLTCYSRIYLGVHYPGDILGGLLVGILSALLVHYIFKKASSFL